jgi:L-ascorbate metabolism protein UlaG (beta-lactamase superfamily)
MAFFGKIGLMEITYLGHSSFKIRGKDATLVTDPYNSAMVGLSYPKTEADIVTVSHQHKDHSDATQICGSPFVISGPGEYEVKGVLIFGIATFHDSASGSQRGKNTIFAIEMDGLRLAHLGDLGHKLTAEQLEELNGVDILFVPVGGVYTLNAEEAVAVISQIEPKIVIPMHYRPAGAKSTLAESLDDVSAFLKAIGAENAPLSKLVVSRDKLPEERQIIILERKG